MQEKKEMLLTYLKGSITEYGRVFYEEGLKKLISSGEFNF